MKPKILLVYPNLPLMMAPAISVGIFNSICKKHGCDVKLFETTEYSDAYSNRHIRMTEMGASRKNKDEEVKDMFHIKPTSEIIPDFIKLVEEFNPDLILMSVQEDVWDVATDLLDSIKHLKIPNLLGGVFCISASNIVLSNSLVNFVCTHEGERVVVDFIDAIKSNTDFKKIKGITYKDRFGLIQKNPPQELCDITEVVPDFTCFESKRWQRPMGGKIFKRAISMETYRGCPYNCTYCNSPNTRDLSTTPSKFLRTKSAEVIEREFLYYKDLYDPDLVLFIDDSFLARPKKEIFEFCEMWKKYKIPFWFNTRIENCKPDVLSALKEAGVYRMTFGIESGNQKYRKDILDRNVSNETYKEYFQYINDSNIPYSLNVIIGMPFETREMVLETASLVHDSKGYDGLTIAMFQPYTGTKLRKLAEENNFIDSSFVNGSRKNGIGGFLDSYNLKMPQPYLQKDEVVNLANTFALYAHFPKERWVEIYEAETNEDKYKELMSQYQKEFFGDIQQGGLDRINSKFCNKHDSSSTYHYEPI
jgi:radical SAM superfamily enzyme YgiQ (UPF0313 family)